MVQRIIKKKHSTATLGAATTPDPPSPALSAVHASGVSAPEPKIKLGSSSVTPIPSSRFLTKIGIDSVTTTDNDKGPTKPQVKLSKGEEEVRTWATPLPPPSLTGDNSHVQDLAQSRWFVRPWSLSLRSAPVTTTPQTTQHESCAPSLEQAAPTGGGTDTYSEEQTRILGDTPVGTAVTETLTHALESSDPSLPIIQSPAAPVDTIDAITGNAGQGDIPRKDPNTQQGWIGWLWYGSQHTTVPTPTQDQSTQHGPQQTVLNTFLQPPEQEVVTDVTSPAYVNTNVTAPSEPSPEHEHEHEHEHEPTRSTWFGLWGGNSVRQSVVAKVMNTQGEPPSDEVSATAASKTIPPIQGVEGETSEVVNVLLEQVESTTVPVNDAEIPIKPVAMTYGWSFWYRSGENKTAAFSSKSSTVPSSEPSENVRAQPVGGENSAVIAGDSCQLVDNKPATTLVVSPQAKPSKVINGPAIPASNETTLPTALAVNKCHRICPPNHIFPNFDSCYNILETPSIYCTLTRLFKKPSEVAKNHLYRIRTPRQVKKAVAIGVHG